MLIGNECCTFMINIISFWLTLFIIIFFIIKIINSFFRRMKNYLLNKKQLFIDYNVNIHKGKNIDENNFGIIHKWFKDVLLSMAREEF